MRLAIGAYRPGLVARFIAWMVAVSVSPVAFAAPEGEPIKYTDTQATDPIARLQDQLDHGKAELSFDSERGYLESVLKALAIPHSSQTLVFSKTSIQRAKINPHKPRAVYFNDDTYIGYVRGGQYLEVASVDPKLGAVFYTLKQSKLEKPKLNRINFECLQCHDSELTRAVPGLLMRSVYPDMEGDPIQTAGSFVTNDHSPIAERWGGWYVTGQYGQQHHMGNMTCDDSGQANENEFFARANLANLSKHLKTEAYLRDTSDIVALMVLGHQQHVHNLITSTGYYVRTAVYEVDQQNMAAGRISNTLPPNVQMRVDGACDILVRGLLFCGETKLAEPISSSAGFIEDFSTRGIKDSAGRSLRDFDLKHRLFKYPLSYLIYSEQFDALPVEARTVVYRRLFDVLTGVDTSDTFAHLTPETRQAILEIIRQTKPNLSGYWKAK